MKRFTYYLLSLTLISSFHLVGMDITDISSAHEPDDETSESIQRVSKNTPDQQFLTKPKTPTFKETLKTKLLERMNRKISPKASPASTSKKPVTIAEVETMVGMLNRVEQNPINQMNTTNISSARVRKNTLNKMDIRFLTESEPMTFKASPAPTSKRPVAIAEVELEALESVEINKVEHDLVIYRSADKSQYYIRCDRCSVATQIFISGNKLKNAYRNLREHLKKTHRIPKKQVLIELPHLASHVDE